MDIYSENILHHRRNPHHYGEMKNADFKASDANPLCGDKITVAVKVKNGKVSDASFFGHGCAISQAAASMLMDQIIGKPTKDVANYDKEILYKLLGVSLSPARIKCALLSLDVLRKALIKTGVPKKAAVPKSGLQTFNDRNPFYKTINQVLDPETGIGVADMGLIYAINDKKGIIHITMTLTSMSCPAGPQMTEEIDTALRKQKGVKDVIIEIVWDPPWSPERMKPEIKSMLFGL